MLQQMVMRPPQLGQTQLPLVAPHAPLGVLLVEMLGVPTAQLLLALPKALLEPLQAVLPPPAGPCAWHRGPGRPGTCQSATQARGTRHARTKPKAAHRHHPS